MLNNMVEWKQLIKEVKNDLEMKARISEINEFKTRREEEIIEIKELMLSHPTFLQTFK